jgi:DNA-binding transcriptional MerR regulator
MEPGTESSPLDAYPESRIFFRIGDVADIVGVKPYVLRYWESEFPQISPSKSASGHRVYQRSDVETLLAIKKLLHDERYSIEGARKRLKSLAPSKPKGTDEVETEPSLPVDFSVVRTQLQELRDVVNVPAEAIFRSFQSR